MSKYVTEVIDERRYKLTVSFADENVDLTGETVVAGGEAEALAYAPFFEADLRRNFADKFPQPEPIIINPEMEGM